MRPNLSQFSRKPLPLLLCGALAVLAAPAYAYEAEIVSLIGKGETRATTKDDWKAAALKQQLNQGAFVRTGDLSQMALLLRDQTQLRLNQNSMVQIKEVTPGGTTQLDLNLGRMWSQAKRKVFALGAQPAVTIRTPNATAGIRGTDWELVVDKEGTAILTVLSGEVDFYNDLGAVKVLPNEQARVEKGKAPTKVLLTNARERVQWVTAYRPQPRRWLATIPTDLQPLVDAIEGGRYGAALGTLESRAGDAAAARLLADMYIFLGRIPEAIALLEKQPDDARAAALLARALLISDRAPDAGKVLAAAAAKFPGDAEVRLAQGDLARFEGDAAGAKSAFRQALASDPKNAEGWFGLGRIEAEREAVKDGREMLNQAISLNPAGPGYRGELATLESFANEFAAAEKSFSDALAQQPDDYVALTGLGILDLKRGNPEAAMENFLKAGVIEPRYARGALYTGVAYYQLNNHRRAVEMFHRAAELDPKDPLPHMMLSLVASDRMELGDAVASARRASELMPYLKSLNQLLNNQKGNANVGAALAQFGMEDWALAYAYNAYSPYWAGSPLFLADRYSGTFNKNSELFKGFLADPTVFGASNRFNTLVASPGNYATLGARLVEQDLHDRGVSVTANGYSVTSMPFTYYVSGDFARVRPGDNNLRVDGDNYTVGLGAKPSHELGLFVFANDFSLDSRTTSVDLGLNDTSVNMKNKRVDGGFSYKFSPTSVMWLKAGGEKDETNVGGSFVAAGSIPGLSTNGRIDRNLLATDQNDLQFRHTFDLASDWQLSWGGESARQDKSVENRLGLSPLSFSLNGDDIRKSDLAYVSNKVKVRDDLLVQADLVYSHVTKEQWLTSQTYYASLGSTFPYGKASSARSDVSYAEFNPSLGMAWNPIHGQTLRVAAQKWRRPVSVNTLAPTDTAGIAVDDRLVGLGGELKRIRAQYEWEIGTSTFVQGFVDSKKVSNVPLAVLPGAISSSLVADATLEDLERLRNRSRLSPAALDFWEATPSFGEADVRTVGFSANRVIASNLSGTFRYNYNYSRNTGPGLEGNQVPWLARHLASAGLNWLPMARWQLGTTATYRGKRYMDEANTELLNAGWNLGFRSYWESVDKRTSVEVIVENLHADKKSAPIHSPVIGAQVQYRF
ncbi:MAG: tetratricopeptide repeat protein [Sulfuricella sp.]|nr:tetratricopeptide repeat protein [Sulfuricella sp.]